MLDSKYYDNSNVFVNPYLHGLKTTENTDSQLRRHLLKSSSELGLDYFQ